MVSTTYKLTYNSPMTIITSISVNNPSSIKPLRNMSELLQVKLKTSVCNLGAAKPKHKNFIRGNRLC